MMGNDFGKLMQNTEINDETCPEMLKNLALLIQVYRKDKAGYLPDSLSIVYKRILEHRENLNGLNIQ